MSIECVWRGEKPDYEDRHIGDCFWSPFGPYELVSDHYKANVAAVRRPICVVLPVRGYPDHFTHFVIDSAPSADPRGNWDVDVDLDSLVVGAKPSITVKPSIKVNEDDQPFGWHGWMTDGVIDGG